MATRRGHDGVAWPEARRLARAAARPAPPVLVPLEQAVGHRLVEDLRARTDLPVADLSAMDGWAVAGPPPWRVVADLPVASPATLRLAPGECAGIVTGGVLPAGADTVLPVEHGRVTDGTVEPGADAPARRRTHVRRAGEEARQGDVLLPAGAVVTPPVVGLAAAAGHEGLRVAPSVTVEVLVLGDELVSSGVQSPGATRDALGPQLPAWLTAFGTAAPSVRRLPDGLDVLVQALQAVRSDLVVTTGGTSVGPRDHVREAVRALGGHVVVDGVRVKPGHPMLLAELPGGVVLVGLPGNPFAACAGLLTLVRPLVAGLRGHPETAEPRVRVDVDQPPRAGDGHRLLPVALVADDGGTTARVLPSCGSAMLRGLALADGLVVVPPGGAVAGDALDYLALPWSSATAGLGTRPSAPDLPRAAVPAGR